MISLLAVDVHYISISFVKPKLPPMTASSRTPSMNNSPKINEDSRKDLRMMMGAIDEDEIEESPFDNN